MTIKKLFRQIVFILILSSILGFSINFHLVKNYFQGEFRRAFLRSEEYPSIRFISLAEAEELFSRGVALFIDTRSEEIFQKGHILGARNIPFVERKEEKVLDLLSFPLEKTLVVYCDGSDCQSSVELAKLLHKKDFKDIRIFFGGWLEWVSEGLPVDSRSEDASK
ncbi:MAG: rhodanese-like domain-containing protein [Candidatus Aminicenantes bacterium]|nr:MAG: rhodanese-like domain-containing protein [Candidatus Aminicenantes bacterium]